MQIPKLSIVIPCYNAERYICNCLDSIIVSGKDNESQYEIVIVNDGSTDNTFSMLENYEKAIGGGKIKVFTTENSGVSASRNRRIIESHGEYIWFIDADDDIEPEAIPLLMQVLDFYETDGIVFNFEYVKTEQRPDRGAANEKLVARLLHGNEILDEISARLFGLSQRNVDRMYRGEFIHDGGFLAGGAVWHFIFRRDILMAGSLFFRNHLAMGEDVMFILRYLCDVNKIIVVENSLYNYYERPSGALVRIHSTPRLLFDCKMALAAERETINALYIEKHGRDMSHCYNGSLMLSAMELFIKLSRESLQNMNLFRQYANLPSVRKAIKSISTVNAPLKYKLPIRILQHGFTCLLFAIVWTAQRIGVSVG